MAESKHLRSIRRSSVGSSLQFITALASIVLLLCSLPGSSTLAQTDEARKIPILLVVDATKPIDVDYRTGGGLLRHLILSVGLAPAAIDGAISSKAHSQNSELLREAVGEFDRKPMVELAIVAAFHAGSPYFEVVIPAASSSYGSPGQIDYDKARADGYPYVLAIREEFAGMITAWAMNTLSATSSLRYELLDATTGKRLADGRLDGYSAERHDLNSAIRDRSYFVSEDPPAVQAASGRIYGTLYKGGYLHAMAEAHGLGKEVPDVGVILDRYAKYFDYRFDLPKGWHDVKGPTKFSMSLEPKNSDRMKFGVSFVVDLLIEDFRQNVTALEEYIGIFFGRLQGKGFSLETTQAFDGFTLKEPYEGFLVQKPGGTAKEIMLFRRLDDRFVIIYDVIFLDDYEGFLKKYRKDIEWLINNAQITVHPQ